MAIDFLSKGASVHNFPAADAQNSSSYTYTANKYYLVAITQIRSDSVDPVIGTLSGWGITWTPLADNLWTSTGTTRRRTQVFGGFASTSASGALTFSYPGSTPDKVLYTVDEVAGADVTTPVVLSNVKISGPASVNTTPAADITFDAFGNALNKGWVLTSLNTTGQDVVYESTFTTLTVATGTGSPAIRHATAYCNDATPDLTPAISVASGTWVSGEIGLEIKALIATEPAAIDDLSGVAGDTSVELSWTAPIDGGAPITDYVIQYRTGATLD